MSPLIAEPGGKHPTSAVSSTHPTIARNQETRNASSDAKDFVQRTSPRAEGPKLQGVGRSRYILMTRRAWRRRAVKRDASRYTQDTRILPQLPLVRSASDSGCAKKIVVPFPHRPRIQLQTNRISHKPGSGRSYRIMIPRENGC